MATGTVLWQLGNVLWQLGTVLWLEYQNLSVVGSMGRITHQNKIDMAL